MIENVCPVCRTKAVYEKLNPTVECPRCGTFQIVFGGAQLLSDWTDVQRANLSGWIREHPDTPLTFELIRSLSVLRTPSVGEKADKLLLYLSKIHRKPSETFLFSGTAYDEVIPEIATRHRFKVIFASASWVQDSEELNYLISDYLAGECGFIQQVNGVYYKITPAGWSHIDELRRANPESKIGFIAMSFHYSMNPVHMAIDEGIRKAGYEPLRIDQKEHNEWIVDEIMAGIRQSKFVVADFTQQKNGVYFEAGFAKGLGLPLVWLCRKDEEEKLHFDTMQFNHIFWEDDKLDLLTQRLQKRIEGSDIGPGPLKKSE